MERQFTFDSDHFGNGELCNQILVTVDVHPDGTSEILELFDTTEKVVRNLSDFPENEQKQIRGWIVFYEGYVS